MTSLQVEGIGAIKPHLRRVTKDLTSKIHPCHSHKFTRFQYNCDFHLQKDYFGLELLDGFIYVHVNLGRNPVSHRLYKILTYMTDW